MKPEIISVTLGSGRQTYSAMADVHDNSAMPIDFHAVADSVSTATAHTVSGVKDAVSSASSSVKSESEGEGGLKQFFKGILGDAGKKVAA